MTRFAKTVNETFIVEADFTPALASGATLNSATVTIYDVYGTDVTLTLTSTATASVTGNVARSRLSAAAGILGMEYRIVFKGTCSNTDVLEKALPPMKIRPSHLAD